MTILQSQTGRKVDDPGADSADPSAERAQTGFGKRLPDPPLRDDEQVLDPKPVDPSPKPSLVRRIHEMTTARAVDELRGSDGLVDQWELRDRLRAGRRLERQQAKLRR